MKKNVLKRSNIVKKTNILNEIRATNMSLQELRFLSIYLSKINSNDLKSRLVRFTKDDFQKIMEIGRVNVAHMKQTTDNLLCKIIHVPYKNGYDSFQLFKRCKVYFDDGEWQVEIDAHDEALPYMFDYKDRYFTYKLWNALRLKSSNQLRMYELLKQYEKIGERIFLVEKLREELGIKENEYERFNDFKKRVLDSCKKALQEHTDIQFTYEPYKKGGKGGKVISLRFIIKKNTDYVDQMTIDEFLLEQEEKIIDVEYKETKDTDHETERLNFLSDACENEFSINEMRIIYNILLEKLPYDLLKNEIEVYNYLKRKYDEFVWCSEKTTIQNRFGYFKKMLSQ